MKIINCKRCGQGNLVWATSKAGKYYLTDAEATGIRNANGKLIKTLQLAHQCKTPEEIAVEAGFDEACQRAQVILQALEDSWQQISVLVEQPEIDGDALDALTEARKPLQAELDKLKELHNYNFVLEKYK
jgi:hypothetical protein